MLFRTEPQFAEFAAMLLAGALMGAAAGAFALLRRLMRAGLWLSLVCDVALGAAWAGIAGLFLLWACRGEARAYHFLAMLCGGCLLRCAVLLPLRRLFGCGFSKIASCLRGAACRPFLRRLLR